MGLPGAKTLLDLARGLPGARVAVLDAPEVAAGLAAPGREVADVRGPDALPPCDVAVVPMAGRFPPLMALFTRLHHALAPGGRALLSDLVWQTAPTPDLARAFAQPGHEKVRPIEGWEMQLEHAGFAIVERLDLPAGAWHHEHAHDPARAAALAGDSRGAARLGAWHARRIDE